ncbi:MAG: D-alanine--D-alanine ligase family protein [Chloroflexota bacterium]
MKRTRVGLLFGGKSGEHQVSVSSARSLLSALDPGKYDVVPIGITRQGQWLMAATPEQLLQDEVILELPGTSEALPDVTHRGIVRVDPSGGIDVHQTTVDVVFPLLHGPQGEDGTVQGLFELADIPYVGSGVLGSAVSMDKAMMKTVFAAEGLPGVPFQLVNAVELSVRRDEVVSRIENVLTYPIFVKPCNLGSSVGISKVRDNEELVVALDLAGRHDRRLIVEQGIAGREIECGVLGNEDPVVSVPGEVVTDHEFYDFEAKYSEGEAELLIPADLSPEQTEQVQDLAVRAFRAVDAAGLARVDFFIQESNGAVLLNELNTIPGFTQTSMYPKLWEATGVPYVELADRLIELAFQRHRERRR